MEERSCESVAEHTFGVALLALLAPALADDNLDREHCAALALVHDLAESNVGDITPHDAIDAATKRQREESAMGQLAQALRDPLLLEL